ncbi:MAG: hypothetical protein O7G88_03390 [bacterium]|nr:hypothetical protein [bacterium]
MGNFFHTIQVGDPSGERFIEVEAMADTGATLPFIPSPILNELGIVATQSGNFVLANNIRRSLDIGPALVKIGDEQAPMLVVFGEPNSVALLASVALEQLFLGVDPFNKKLVPVESRARGMRSGTPARRAPHRGQTDRQGHLRAGEILRQAQDWASEHRRAVGGPAGFLFSR